MTSYCSFRSSMGHCMAEGVDKLFQVDLSVVKDQPFSVNILDHINLPDEDSKYFLIFSWQKGLPEGSGIELKESTGILRGSPTQVGVEYLARRPRITVDNKKGWLGKVALNMKVLKPKSMLLLCCSSI